MPIRKTFTTYETEQEQELITKFKKELKELQKDIKKEPNRININYTNTNQKEVINTFKTLYNKCIEKNQIQNLNNILNNLINKLK